MAVVIDTLTGRIRAHYLGANFGRINLFRVRVEKVSQSFCVSRNGNKKCRTSLGGLIIILVQAKNDIPALCAGVIEVSRGVIVNNVSLTVFPTSALSRSRKPKSKTRSFVAFRCESARSRRRHVNFSKRAIQIGAGGSVNGFIKRWLLNKKTVLQWWNAHASKQSTRNDFQSGAEVNITKVGLFVPGQKSNNTHYHISASCKWKIASEINKWMWAQGIFGKVIVMQM